MDLLFAVSGIGFLVLFVIFRLFRRLAVLNRVELFFAFAGALLLLGALTVGHLYGEPSSLLVNGVLATAATLIVFGVLTIIIQAIRGALRQSSGVLLAGIGVLLIAARFFVPAAANYFDINAQVEPISPLLTITPLSRITEVFTPTAPTFVEVTNADIPTTTLTQTPTVTRTARPSITPRPSRTRYASPTPSATPTLPSPCVVVALYNVNMRAEPDLQAELIATIPFDTAVSAYGRNEESTWWFVEYQGSAGWVSSEFVSTTTSCAQLPVTGVQ